jgi:hypothetical protein
MTKLTMEAEVKLSVILTALTKVTAAKLAAMKVSLAFMESEKNATPMAVDESIAHIDSALAEMEEAAEQLRFFRNVLRDDRKPFIKRQASGQHWHSPDLKLSQRDPAVVIAAMMAGLETFRVAARPRTMCPPSGVLRQTSRKVPSWR